MKNRTFPHDSAWYHKKVYFMVSITLFLSFLFYISGCGGGGTGITGIVNTPTINPVNPSQTETPGNLPVFIPNSINNPSSIITNGKIVVPPDVIVSSMVIFSQGGKSYVLSDGKFSVKIPLDKVSAICGVVPNKNFAYMFMTFGDKDGQEQILINFQSTAEAIIYMSPYFLNTDIDIGFEMMKIIKSNTKVKALADVLEKIYQEVDPLKTQEFHTAYNEAVKSVLNDLISNSRNSNNKILEGSSETSRIIYLSKIPGDNTSGNLELDRTKIDISKSGNNYQANFNNSVKLTNMELIDSIVDVAELDASLIDKMNFSSYDIRYNTKVYPRKNNGVRDLAYISSKSIFSYLNIMKLAAEGMLNVMKGLLSINMGYKENMVDIPADREGIYIVRIYSGSISKNIDLSLFPEGTKIQTLTAIANCEMLALDLLSMIPIPDSGISIIKDATKNTFKDFIAIYDEPKSLQELISFVYLIAENVTEAIGKSIVKNALDSCEEPLIKFVEQLQKVSIEAVVEGTLVTLKSISKAGEVVHRSASLLVMTDTVTPLESAAIVVGDPFGPPEIFLYSPNPGSTLHNPNVQLEIYILTDNFSNITGKKAYISLNDGTEAGVDIDKYGKIYYDVTLKPGLNTVKVTIHTSDYGILFNTYYFTYEAPPDPNTGNWNVTVD